MTKVVRNDAKGAVLHFQALKQASKTGRALFTQKLYQKTTQTFKHVLNFHRF